MAIKKFHSKGFNGNFSYEGELKYRLIFEKSPIGIFQYSTDAIITECNDRFVEILHSTRERLIGLDMNRLTDRSVLSAITDALNGMNGYYEGPYFTTTSSVQIYVLLKTVPITDSSGRVEGALGIVEDITELYKTQQELSKERENFRLLSTLTTDGASILNIQPNGTFERQWLSISLIKDLGYSPDEIDTFEKWGKIVHPDDLPVYIDGVNRILRGEKVTAELRIISKKGEVRWIQNTVFPEFGIDGKPKRLISAVKDITDRKNAEQELKKQRNLLSGIIEYAPIGIWLVAPDGSYPIINPYFARNIGYGTANFSMTEEEIESCRKSDRAAMSSEGPIESIEEVTFTDGKKHTLRVFKQRIATEKGEILGVLGMVTDISESVQYEKALVEALMKAEESDNLKSAFLANMSHEIRTPLNGVIGFAKFLRNFPDTTPQEREKFLDIISTSADHLLTLINDIIDISKIDVGQLTLNPEPFNINSLLTEIYTFFYNANPDLRKHNITFTFHTALSDQQANIECDKMRLRQVITNLVGNALKFTESGSVAFGYNLEDDGKTLKFFVIDTGIGIPKDKHELIFQRFRQADNSIAKKHGGTGLGLAISKSIVELMGGHIWLESEPGKGSSFYFTIPLGTSVHIDNKHFGVGRDEIKEQLNGKTILLAEDDPNSMYLLKTLIQGLNAQILEAYNGQSAVDIVDANPNISLIIMDIKMPVMNGYEAIKRIRAKYPDIPIIVQTAHTFSNEQAIAKALGCNHFITKPIDASSLYLAIGNSLRMWQK